jgi:hypothetical protein
MSRYVHGARMQPRRAPTRVIECPHCHRFYDVATSFDEHYEGACVAQKSREETAERVAVRNG